MIEFLGNERRTNYCGDLRESDIGKTVCVMGWVKKARKLGSLVFVDLRDRSGIVQLAFDEKTDKEIFEKATPSTSNFCESTGAGDVFAGAFLHKYMESMGTEQIHECLKTGNYFAQKILSVSLCDTKVLANSHNSTSN